MLGVDSEPGIYLQTLTDLFQAIQEAQDNTDYSVSLSYLEVSLPAASITSSAKTSLNAGCHPKCLPPEQDLPSW
jgi:hypothetical protein